MQPPNKRSQLCGSAAETTVVKNRLRHDAFEPLRLNCIVWLTLSEHLEMTCIVSDLQTLSNKFMLLVFSIPVNWPINFKGENIICVLVSLFYYYINFKVS